MSYADEILEGVYEDGYRAAVADAVKALKEAEARFGPPPAPSGAEDYIVYRDEEGALPDPNHSVGDEILIEYNGKSFDLPICCYCKTPWKHGGKLRLHEPEERCAYTYKDLPPCERPEMHSVHDKGGALFSHPFQPASKPADTQKCGVEEAMTPKPSGAEIHPTFGDAVVAAAQSLGIAGIAAAQQRDNDGLGSLRPPSPSGAWKAREYPLVDLDFSGVVVERHADSREYWTCCDCGVRFDQIEPDHFDHQRGRKCFVGEGWDRSLTIERVEAKES